MKSLQSSASYRFAIKPACVDSATDLSFGVYRQWYNFRNFYHRPGNRVVQKPEQLEQRFQKLSFSQGRVWQHGSTQSCMTYAESLAPPGMLRMKTERRFSWSEVAPGLCP
jgi:hypothetical protein